MSRKKREDSDDNLDDFGPEHYEDEISDIQDEAERCEENEIALMDERAKALIRDAPGGRRRQAAGPKPSARPPSWTFDDSGYYSYVLLDGTVALLKNVREALTKAGFDVAISGSSRKPAGGDGKKYDWFIRLIRTTDEDEQPARSLHEEISRCLSPIFAAPATERPVDSVSPGVYRALKEENARLTQANGQLHTELSHLHDTQRSLERGLVAEKAEHANDVKYWALRLATLSSPDEDDAVASSEELERRIVVLSEEKTASELGHSQLETDLLNLIDEYKRELKVESEQCKRLETDCDNLRVQLQVAREEIDALGMRRDDKEPVGDVLQTSLAGFLAITFSKLRFLPRGISLMENEIDWSGAVRVLFQLNFNPGEVRGENFESANGFRELHFSLPGSKDAGRLYYRQKDGAVEVLVSIKNNQRSDCVYLKRMGKVK